MIRMTLWTYTKLTDAAHLGPAHPLAERLGRVLNTRNRWFRLAPLYLLVFAIPTFVVSLVTPGASPNVLFRVVATGAVILAGLGLFVLGGPQWRRGWFWRLGGTAVAAAGATLALWTALLRWPKPGRGGPTRSDAYQITRASSVNASASWAEGGTSVPRS